MPHHSSTPAEASFEVGGGYVQLFSDFQCLQLNDSSRNSDFSHIFTHSHCHTKIVPAIAIVMRSTVTLVMITDVQQIEKCMLSVIRSIFDCILCCYSNTAV